MTADGKQINILIVENNAVLRKGLTDHLELRTRRLTYAETSRPISEALDLLEDNTARVSSFSTYPLTE
jgi:CheY-like chemotaxis protein